tara:strand:+ start:393 stop:1451 length:1059 start_codon:yes stop_codon:yes gene_type:complete
MNKKLSPKRITLIHGNQQFLIEETIKSFIHQILKGREDDYCLERFDIKEMLKSYGVSENNGIEDFLISVETLPMLSDIKVILINNFDLIKKPTSVSDNSANYKLYNSIIKFIEKPPEYIWFLCISKLTKATDFSKKIYNILNEKWEIIKFVSYENSSPINWVLNRSKSKGIPISSEIAQLFIDIVGNDLSILDNELEKMSIFFTNKKISENIIKNNIRSHKNLTIFKMTEALSNKDLLSALEILDNQLKTSPNEHVRLFSIIVMQFRRLISIKSMSKKFYTENEILKNISLPIFLGKQLMIQSKNFKYEELKDIYLELSNLDLRIKFKSNLAPLLLQDLFQSICAGKFVKIP